MIKKCEICGEEFETEKKGNSRKYCFSCSPSYKTTKERSVSITVLRNAMKIQGIKMKGGKCSKCGYDKCIAALDFHHVDSSEKDHRLSNGNTCSWEDFKKELKKCVLLCANCHREEHYNNGI